MDLHQSRYIALLRFIASSVAGGLFPKSILNPSLVLHQRSFSIKDDPCRGNEGQKARADAIKKDFRDADFAINVLPLPKKNAREFDRSIFYGDMAVPPNPPVEDEDDAGEAEAGAVNVKALLENFAVGTRKRRKYATLPLLLPGGGGGGTTPGSCWTCTASCRCGTSRRRFRSTRRRTSE